MASTIKCESGPENEVDPLSTHIEYECLDIKQEEYLVPVVMTETEVCLIPCLAFGCPVSHICVQVGVTPTGIVILL
jgi:hypothetical protein